MVAYFIGAAIMTTHIRDLQPGERFYLLRTMEKYTYIGHKTDYDFPGYRHVVAKEGENTTSDLHHSCHVKRIVRAA